MIRRIPPLRAVQLLVIPRAISFPQFARSRLLTTSSYIRLAPFQSTTLLRLSLRRSYSTPPPSSSSVSPLPTPTTPNPQLDPPISHSAQPPHPLPSHRTNLLRPLLYATVFLLLGASLGLQIRNRLNPPPSPLPNTPADLAETFRIQSLAASLPIVKSLLSSPLHRHWEAYSGLPRSSFPHRLTTGPLSGSRGIGAYQHIFHNTHTNEFTIVVYIGADMCGFPGMVHGGLLATLLDESLGRCAIAGFAERTAVTANLDVRYRRPVRPTGFYVIKVGVMGAEEGGRVEKGKRKAWVKAELQDLEGTVLVEAKGLFVVPKGLALGMLPDEGF